MPRKKSTFLSKLSSVQLYNLQPLAGLVSLKIKEHTKGDYSLFWTDVFPPPHSNHNMSSYVTLTKILIQVT